MMFKEFVKLVSRDANALLVLGGSVTGVFMTGGYYFSMKERYERQVEALKLQLEHERDVRQLHDEYMAQKMNHERDQAIIYNKIPYHPTIITTFVSASPCNFTFAERQRKATKRCTT